MSRRFRFQVSGVTVTRGGSDVDVCMTVSQEDEETAAGAVGEA